MLAPKGELVSLPTTVPSIANSILLGAPERTETCQATVPETVAPAAGEAVARVSVSLPPPVLGRAVAVAESVVLLPPSFLAGPMPSAAKAPVAERATTARRRTR